jgi:hypothetical protein
MQLARDTTMTIVSNPPDAAEMMNTCEKLVLHDLMPDDTSHLKNHAS